MFPLLDPCEFCCVVLQLALGGLVDGLVVLASEDPDVVYVSVLLAEPADEDPELGALHFGVELVPHTYKDLLIIFLVRDVHLGDGP